MKNQPKVDVVVDEVDAVVDEVDAAVDEVDVDVGADVDVDLDVDVAEVLVGAAVYTQAQALDNRVASAWHGSTKDGSTMLVGFIP
jgi:hypothetical protein